MISLLIATAVIILYIINTHLLKSLQKGRKNYPPGPNGWPIIGNFMEFRKNPLTSLTKWKEQYGNIVGLKIGSYRVVILSGVNILKEAFHNPDFISRPNMRPITLFSGGIAHGTLSATNFDDWNEVRRFTIKQLNEIGFGKKQTENILMSNIQFFIQSLKKRPGSLCLHDELMLPITTYVWDMLTGISLNTDQTLELRDTLRDFRKYVHGKKKLVGWIRPIRDMYVDNREDL